MVKCCKLNVGSVLGPVNSITMLAVGCQQMCCSQKAKMAEFGVRIRREEPLFLE